MAADVVDVIIRGDNQLSQAVNAARRDLRGMQDSVQGASRVLSASSDVARAFGAANKGMAADLAEVASGASVAITAVSGLRAAMSALLGPVGLLVAAVGLLIGALVMMRRRADEAADALAKVEEAGRRARDAFQEFVFGRALVGIEQFIDRQMAMTEAIDSTTERLRGRIGVVQNEIIMLNVLSRSTGLTTEQQRKLSDEIVRLQNVLIVLNAQLGREVADAAGKATEALKKLREEQIKKAIDDIVAFNIAVRQWYEREANKARDAFIALASPISTLDIALQNLLKSWRQLGRGPAFAEVPSEALDQAQQLADLMRVRLELGEVTVDQVVDVLKGLEMQLLAEGRLADAARVRLEILQLQGLTLTQLAAAADRARRAIQSSADQWRQWAEDIAEQTRTMDLQASITFVQAMIDQITDLGAVAGPAIVALMRLLQQLQGKVADVVTQMRDSIGRALVDSFQRFFEDVLADAKSFGEALAGFFRSLVNAIISILARLAALQIVKWLGFTVTGLQAGGVVQAQRGLVTQGMVPAVLHPNEVVLPLPPGLRPEDLAKALSAPREAVIQLTIHNVIGDPRALGLPGAADMIGAVVNDISRRGPTMRQIRMTLG